MKKSKGWPCVLLIVLAAMLVFSGCSKSEYDENDYETEETTAATVETTQAAARYNHVAIQNCVVNKQDGSPDFEYYYKCDACGYMGDWPKTASSTGDSVADSFFCDTCNDWKMVYIDTYPQ